MLRLSGILQSAERVGAAVSLLTAIWEVLGLNLYRDIDYDDGGLIVFFFSSSRKIPG
jgi:hypothetical protein